FVNPGATNGYAAKKSEAFCDLAHVKALAKRAKAHGMGLLLDIHYGDTWTSPGKQAKPGAWRELSFAELTNKVHDYTRDVVTALRDNGTQPDMVQVGNEISDGLLFPDGSRSKPENFGALVGAGCRAVREVDPKIKIVLHHHLGRDNAKMRPWLDNFIQRGVDFDLIGMSCYAQAQEGDWQRNFDDLATRYPNHGLLVVEYSGRKRFINELMFNTPSAKGWGTFIWEATRHREAIFDHDGANAGGGQAANFKSQETNAPAREISSNPILPDFHADPSARVFGGKLFVYPSHDAAGATNWQRMVDWHVFSTADMKTWTDHGVIFGLKDITWATKEAWAADCIERNGKYFFFFPAGGQIGVAVADSPTGPFKDALGKPLVKSNEAGVRYTIDPCVFIDDGGQAYLYFGGGRQLAVVKLKADMITRDGPIQILEMPEYYEGIWVHKRNGIYYASYPTRSVGGQANVMTYSVAKSPLGPWEYKGALLDNRSHNVHGSITEFKGQPYLFYHVEGPSAHERRVCVESIAYNDDGTIKPVQMSNGAMPNGGSAVAATSVVAKVEPEKHGGRYDVNALADLYPQMAKDFVGIAPPHEILPPPAPAPTNVAPYILTPPAPAAPRINGAKVFGVRPGSPFLYTIPATGERPMKFDVDCLSGKLAIVTNPESAFVVGLFDGVLYLNPTNGQITGSINSKGEFNVTLRAKNKLGIAEKSFHIVCGDTIALTPPMGWNSWNCFAGAVSAERVKAAADAFVRAGLINHGWSYINVDDFWQNHRDSKDATLRGEFRKASGEIQPNSRFPDMKELADYIHSLGLKAGLYSSPGPWTCGGCAGSWQHEAQDAAAYAAWGFDYLKYDWCSYGGIAAGETNFLKIRSNGVNKASDADAVLPYTVMGKFLAAQKRDIVFSLCQYGMADVWKWGSTVNGTCWRTTGDITDTWRSLSGIGFKQDKAAPFAGPGHWNDPDMLIVGHVGWGKPHPSRLTPDEQYTHISLWCLLAAPLLIGCDLEKLDDFTLSLLTNDEVLAVDQDSLGQQATCVSADDNLRVFAKDLDDGSKAVGLFNLGNTPAKVVANWNDLKLFGPRTVRDLWRQQDLGKFDKEFSATVPAHGVVLVKANPSGGGKTKPNTVTPNPPLDTSYPAR
ncbi:MAG: hypothetical protein RLZZ350_1997, partial [Verrucomicrobiota bacterium]